MFKWFKKKEKPEEELLETIFPPAEDMLERTKLAWSEKQPEEILCKMNEESSKGHRYCHFFNSTLSERTERELKQQHYKVDKGESDNSPYFTVRW